MAVRILRGLYQFSVYAVGICVLLAAITATIIRLFLPDIGMYRSEIEAWVSNYMNLPVAIRTLDADWQGWTPYLYLQDIDLLNRSGTAPIINFESAQVSINPIATLLRRQIVPERLIISGFELRLTRAADGSIAIEGLDTGNRQSSSGTNDELADWLFGQGLIELQHVKIEWLDQTLAQLPVLLSDVNLVLRSDGRRLQVEGSSQLPSMYGDSFAFSADVRGDLLSSNWSAELYIQGSNINPDFWYRAYWPPDLNLVGGNATVSMWSSWQRARPIAMKAKLDYEDFTFMSDKGSQLEVEKLSAWLNSRQNRDQSWTLNLDINEFTTQNGRWQPARLNLHASPATSTYTLNFDYLKLDDLHPVVSSLSFLPDVTTRFINDHPLRGFLTDSRIQYQKSAPVGKQLAFDLQVNDLDTPAVKNIPAFKGVGARVTGTLENGRLQFNQDEATIEYASVENNETIPVQLDGSIAWSGTRDEYLLYTNQLQLKNQDIEAELSGTIGIGGRCCRMNLMAVAIPTDVEALIRSLPYTSRFKLRDWLQRSIYNGTVSRAMALFRGPASNFPFDKHDGVFELQFDVSGATLKYSPNWPSIDNIDGVVGFSGRTMTIEVDKGTIFDAPVENATAIIPDLFQREKILNIDGRVTGLTADLKRYVEQSPLETNKSLSQLANSMSNEGDIGLDLQLMIPLRQGRRTEVTGNLEFTNSTLTPGFKDMQFTGIAGHVQFTRNSINAENITALYDNQPVQLAIQSQDTSGQSPVTVTLTGNADTAFINSQLNRYLGGAGSLHSLLGERMSGMTEWQAALTFAKNGEDISRTLQISTDLYGMNVNLPDPFAKHAYLKTRLEINKHLDNDQLPLTVRYGNIMTSEIMIDDEAGLEKMDINFGNKTYRYSEHKGILLYGQVDQLALDEWFSLFKSGNGTRNSDSIPDVQVDLAINDLHVLGQTFSDILFNMQREDDHWNIRLGGDNVKGTVTVPISLEKEEPIVADLDYLRLKKGSGGKEENDDNTRHVVPSKLPSITAHVDSFQYANLDLGEMDFIAGAADYGLYIDTLSFTKPAFTIEAKGKWNGTDTQNNSSDFTIQAHAAELDLMLQTFGYDVTAVKKGETNVVIDANWEGTPMDFSLNKLNGTLGLKIGKGQLLDIQPAAGRLFGLLSLQTLPRRLTLDFSDLFGDGMAFDVIEGNFIIRNGDAFTNDLAMKGPSVDILISGRTGLSTHDYDQVAIVTPQISDSLAVASGFLGPMGLGLGTVLYFAGNLFEPLQDSINNIMKFQYSISGSWNDPVIEKHRHTQSRG